MKLKEYTDGQEAYIDKGFLRSNGIHAIVEQSALSSVFGLTAASGNPSFTICVPDSEYQKAIELLRYR